MNAQLTRAVDKGRYAGSLRVKLTNEARTQPAERCDARYVNPPIPVDATASISPPARARPRKGHFRGFEMVGHVPPGCTGPWPLQPDHHPWPRPVSPTAPRGPPPRA